MLSLLSTLSHPMVTPFSNIDIIDVDQEHMLGRVHSMIAGSVVDGPGIRHTIFLQGCQFKCLYCHNRDTWNVNAGQLFTVAELVDEVLSYATFMDKSRGGVTVTGGEPMLQPQFLSLLFKQLHKMGIHTCLDTNGYASKHIYGDVLDSLLEHTNLVMLDIKHMDNEKHKILTGIDNDIPLNFAKHLHEVKQPTRIRYVVVPGYTDDMDDIRKLAEFIAPMDNVQLLELLPYHHMGRKKWIELDQTYALENVESPTPSVMRKLKSTLESDYGLKVLL